MTHFRYLLFFSCLFIKLNLCAQTGIERSIKEYQVTVRTDNGSIKGLLQQVNKYSIDVIGKSGAKNIPVTSIKEIKVKFDRERKIALYEGMAKTGIGIVESSFDDDRPNIRKDENGRPIYDNPADEPTLSDAAAKALLGTATIATAAAADQVTRLIYKPSIEAFKVHADSASFTDIKRHLSLYSVATQASPDYSRILDDQLKESIKVKKLDIKDNPFRNKDLIKR
ncbi:hypothetical protein GQF61_04430 [Sphingobacterium sp. DK4209]|uniref:DUF4230 domain-containing protein n=1 Tax=Sphingobacterium zhuxiongii TaxID=2662364 RepID=A0A5Q0Q9D6_9SPHI|nr:MULTISPECIES: hypothetical protein [unclassified Sphingobacterium]MVZ65087.1 hypothetical protein [Sphingobacterium sp. DK4209]QGA26036.1 hypothetical protein GFH32_06760 [Sphingobacterium sp. dk4302]